MHLHKKIYVAAIDVSALNKHFSEGRVYHPPPINHPVGVKNINTCPIKSYTRTYILTSIQNLPKLLLGLWSNISKDNYHFKKRFSSQQRT